MKHLPFKINPHDNPKAQPKRNFEENQGEKIVIQSQIINEDMLCFSSKKKKTEYIKPVSS